VEEKQKRNIIALGFTSFFNDISSEAIYGLLPLYLQNPSMIGFVGGLFNGLGSIFKFVFGYLSDKIGKRKPLVFLGYLTSAISKFTIAISKGPLLVVGIFGDRVGKGIRTSPRDAILAEAKRRGYAFGLHRAMDTLGAITGAILMYFLLRIGWNIRKAMLFAALIGFFSLLPLFIVVEPKIKKRKAFGSFKLSRESKVFLFATFFMGLASISPMLLIKQASEFVGIESLLFYTLYNISYVISTKRLGSFSDIVGRKKILLLSSLTISAALAFGSLGKFFLLFSFVLYGIGIGGFMSTAPAEIGDIEKEAKGTALGIFHMIYGIGVLIGSIAVGNLIERMGNSALLYPCFAGALSLPFFLKLK